MPVNKIENCENIVKNCKLSGKQPHSTRTETRTTLLCRYVIVCQEQEAQLMLTTGSTRCLSKRNIC